jgi:hypothetical protein
MKSIQFHKTLLAAVASLTLTFLTTPTLLGQAAPPDAPAPSLSVSGAVVASSQFPEVFPAAVLGANTSSTAISSATPAPIISSPALISQPGSAPERPHRFFDKWNIALFSGSAALDSADFAVTRANLQTTGGRELNPIVRMFGRSTGGLALNFAGEAAGTVGLSYFFHRTGHYKLERAISIVNIGASGIAVGYSSAHH